jgi:hypothetical protein
MAVAVSEVTTVTIGRQPSRVGACDLCAREQSVLQAAVVLRAPTGARAAFGACHYCARALRRLAAAIEGPMRFGGRRRRAADGGGAAAVVDGVVEADDLRGAELIHEYPWRVQDSAGRLYAARTHGAERADGTWVGWLEFVTLDGATTLRTNRETTQPGRGALVYWAAGLTPLYLDSAFLRARRPHVVRLA